MVSPGSLQQSNGVSKLELSCISTLYEGTQFCLYFTEKNAQQHEGSDHVTSQDTQIRCAAPRKKHSSASLFPELFQSPHKCNGGRIKLPAKRQAAYISSSKISALTDN